MHPNDTFSWPHSSDLENKDYFLGLLSLIKSKHLCFLQRPSHCFLAAPANHTGHRVTCPQAIKLLVCGRLHPVIVQARVSKVKQGLAGDRCHHRTRPAGPTEDGCPLGNSRDFPLDTLFAVGFRRQSSSLHQKARGGAVSSRAHLGLLPGEVTSSLIFPGRRGPA